MSGIEEWEIEAELGRMLGEALVSAMAEDGHPAPDWWVDGNELLFFEGHIKLSSDALAYLKRRFPDRGW